MSFEKFRILLWKNWIIQKRHWKRGLFELIFPVLLVILFTWIKKEYTKDFQETVLDFYPKKVEDASDCFINGRTVNKIAFSPASIWVNELVSSAFGGNVGIQLEAFESSAALNKFLTPESGRTTNESLFGIEFDDSLAVNLEIFPKSF